MRTTPVVVGSAGLHLNVVVVTQWYYLATTTAHALCIGSILGYPKGSKLPTKQDIIVTVLLTSSNLVNIAAECWWTGCKNCMSIQ